MTRRFQQGHQDQGPRSPPGEVVHGHEYVAYASPLLTREIRAGRAKEAIRDRFSDRQQGFLDLVLSHYVSEGVGELDMAKLSPLLKLKSHDSIPDALADLGSPLCPTHTDLKVCEDPELRRAIDDGSPAPTSTAVGPPAMAHEHRVSS